MSNEKRPYKGGHGKPGNGKFSQGSGQGEGGAKRKRRRRSGTGSGSGSGVSDQNRQQSQNQRSQGQRSQGRPQKWEDNSRPESRTGRRFDGLTSVARFRG